MMSFIHSVFTKLKNIYYDKPKRFGCILSELFPHDFFQTVMKTALNSFQSFDHKLLKINKIPHCSREYLNIPLKNKNLNSR